MEFIIIGLVTAINLIVIIKKLQKNRKEDAILDATLFVVVVILFSGSYAGMVVAMIASLVISIYLYANPPNFFSKHLGAVSIPKFDVSRVIAAIKHFDISKHPRRK